MIPGMARGRAMPMKVRRREAPRLTAASSSSIGMDLNTAVIVQTAKTRAPTMWMSTTPGTVAPRSKRYRMTAVLAKTGNWGKAWGSRKSIRISGLAGTRQRARA